jgi:hypothetical protein
VIGLAAAMGRAVIRKPGTKLGGEVGGQIVRSAAVAAAGLSLFQPCRDIGKAKTNRLLGNFNRSNPVSASYLPLMPASGIWHRL